MWPEVVAPRSMVVGDKCRAPMTRSTIWMPSAVQFGEVCPTNLPMVLIYALWLGFNFHLSFRLLYVFSFIVVQSFSCCVSRVWELVALFLAFVF